MSLSRKLKETHLLRTIFVKSMNEFKVMTITPHTASITTIEIIDERKQSSFVAVISGFVIK